MLRDPLIVPKVSEPLYISAPYVALMQAAATLFKTEQNQSGLLELRTFDDGPGSSKRKGQFSLDTKVSMAISHSQSSENKPLITERVMQRLDFTRFNNVLSRNVGLGAYAVVAFPQGNTFSEGDAVAALHTLAWTILLGGMHNPDSNDSFDVAAGQTFLRLLSGEA